MMPLRDHLRREVASLYSFVDSIAQACASAPKSSAYPEPSIRFFDYIAGIAAATQKHVTGFEAHADDSDEDFEESRAELQTIRAAWRELHRFVRPSTNADTLNQPTALIAALIDRLRLLKGFEQSNFVIFHSDTFDYLQVNPRSTGETLDQLARIVDAQRFDRNVGLIGIPNSQGNRLFMNCLIAHEIGEYVFAKRDVEPALAITSKSAIAKHLGAEFEKLTASQQSGVTQTIVQWAKEVFCDLFAVRFIGPCYSFAYIELFDLPNLLDKNGHKIIDEIYRQPQIRFYRSYPSHPFRIKVQVEALKAEGWWDFIKDLDCRSCAVLQALLELDISRFVSVEPTGGESRAPFVSALLDIMPDIRRQVGDATDGLDSGLHEYSQLWKPIAEYVSRGVVPSTLIVKVESGDYVQVHPTSLTLVNAACRCYLVGVDDLMSGITDQDTASPERRAFWMKRIQEWTAKALEDIALMRSTT